MTIKDRRARAVKKGLCSSCMKRRPPPGRRNCEFCCARTAKYDPPPVPASPCADRAPIEVVYSDAPATKPAIQHCADPEHCSICMGVQPRRVVNVGGVLQIKGKVVVPQRSA
jgi:hypothetical protein